LEQIEGVIDGDSFGQYMEERMLLLEEEIEGDEWADAAMW